MTTDGAHGLVHAAAWYDGDEQLLELALPFVQGGLDAGEPTVVALDDRHAELIRSVVAASPHLSFVSGQYNRPATVLKSFDTLVTGHPIAGCTAHPHCR